MRDEEIKKLLQIGVLLSSERDLDRLLEQILECVMELTRCDAGTLYLLEDDKLWFRIMRNNTLKTYSGANGEIPALPPVALSRESVCALAVLDNKTIRIEDVRHCQEYDLTGPIRYDAITGYNTVSMLVVPMRSRTGETIGVLQLINAMDETGNICPFTGDMALILESLASQAAITIQNVRYIKEIQELFQSFVRVMSSAIDQRTPYNANHSRRMAECCGRFLDFLNARAEEAGQEPPFSAQHREELVMSVWLHDVGKVVTPLEVMDKAKRLSPLQEARLQNRILDVWLTKRIDCLEGRITQEELEAVRQETGEAAEHIARINGAGFLPDEELAWLEELRGRTYNDQGQERPWITGEEYAMLSIRKGTLSPEERKIMEDHVVVTDTLLSQIHFSKELSHVREWAAAHHELLDGSGYPCRRRGEDIPQEVRIITILDIFDALVADDRPYKPGMPVPRALSILETMADKEGKLDPALTRLFVQSRCWETGETGRPEQKD